MLSLVIVWILLIIICFNLAVLVPIFLISDYKRTTNKRLFWHQHWPLLLLFGLINPLIAPFPWQLNRIIHLSNWLYVGISIVFISLYVLQLYRYSITPDPNPDAKLEQHESLLLELILFIWFHNYKLSSALLTWCVLFCIMNLAYLWKYLRLHLTPQCCLHTIFCLFSCLPVLIVYYYVGSPILNHVYRQEILHIFHQSPPEHIIRYNSEIAFLLHRNRIIYLYGNTQNDQYLQPQDILQYPDIQSVGCQSPSDLSLRHHAILCCIEGNSTAVGKTAAIPLVTHSPTQPTYQLIMLYKSIGNCSFVNSPKPTEHSK